MFESGSEFDQGKGPNVILMKVDISEAEAGNVEKSFIIGGYAAHSWRNMRKHQSSHK